MFNFKKTTALIIAIMAISAIMPIIGLSADVLPIFEPAGFSSANFYTSTAGRSATFECVRPTPDGGYVVAGYVQAAGGNVQWGYVTGSAGTHDALIIKFSSNGTVEWAKNAGSVVHDYFNDIAVVSDGYIAVGYSFSESTNLKDDDLNKDYNWGHVGTTGFSDAIIVKFDLNGNALWSKNLGGTHDDYFKGVTIYENKIIAVGHSFSTSGSTNLGTQNWGNVGLIDAIVVQFDMDGEILWSKNYGGTDGDYFYGVTMSGDKIIAVGETGGESTNLVGANWGYVGTDRNAIIVELDIDGNALHSKNLGGARAGTGITTTYFQNVTASEGKIVAVGAAYGASTNLGDKNWGHVGTVNGSTKPDAIIVRFDADLNVLWSKNLGSELDDIFYDITVYGDKLLAVGRSLDESENLGNKNWGNVNLTDCIAVSFDMDGNILWSKNFGGAKHDYFYGVAYRNNEFITVGTSQDVSTNLGDGGNWEHGLNTNWNAIIVKFTETATGEAEVILPASGDKRGIVASYTADNRLIGIKIYDAENTAAGANITARISTVNATKIKTFRWSSDDNLTPDNAAKTYIKSDEAWIEE